MPFVSYISTSDIDSVIADENPQGVQAQNLTGLSYFWTKLKGAFARITHRHSYTDIYDLTPNKALISNDEGGIGVSDVTDTELSYLTGCTGPIQEALNTLSKHQDARITFKYVDPDADRPQGIYGIVDDTAWYELSDIAYTSTSEYGYTVYRHGICVTISFWPWTVPDDFVSDYSLGTVPDWAKPALAVALPARSYSATSGLNLVVERTGAIRFQVANISNIQKGASVFMSFIYVV